MANESELPDQNFLLPTKINQPPWLSPFLRFAHEASENAPTSSSSTGVPEGKINGIEASYFALLIMVFASKRSLTLGSFSEPWGKDTPADSQGAH